jgi:hypothetical protein
MQLAGPSGGRVFETLCTLSPHLAIRFEKG